MIRRNAKRLLLVLGFALLLPGTAGAAGFGLAEPSFWSDAAALFDRLWDGLTADWTNGGSIDPSGGEGTDNGGSIDPSGGLSGAAVCLSGDCNATIDPNG